MLIRTRERRGLVRVCGTTTPGLVAAAALVNAFVNATRRGVGWFECSESDVPKIRAEHAVVTASLATWLWMMRAGKISKLTSGCEFIAGDPGQPTGG